MLGFLSERLVFVGWCFLSSLRADRLSGLEIIGFGCRLFAGIVFVEMRCCRLTLFLRGLSLVFVFLVFWNGSFFIYFLIGYEHENLLSVFLLDLKLVRPAHYSATNYQSNSNS